MSSFFSIASLSHIASELRRVFIRFPLSAVLSACVTGLFFYYISREGELDYSTSYLIGRSIITGIVLFFLATAGALFIEDGKDNWKTKTALFLGIAAF